MGTKFRIGVHERVGEGIVAALQGMTLLSSFLLNTLLDDRHI